MYLAIVIYNIKLSDSLALRSLLNSGYSDVVLVYVNGGCNFDMELSENFEIINNNDNLYLAKNYIDACERCLSANHKSIGFFDQDTEVDINYLKRASNIVSDKIPVVYPILSDQNNLVVSPIRLSGCGFEKSNVVEGAYRKIKFIGINSGSMFDPKVFLKLVDPSFELDFLDHVVCHKIYSFGLNFYVLSSKMQHCLSVRDGIKLGESRQMSIFESERAYYFKYRRFGRLFWLFIVAFRIIKSMAIKDYPFSLKVLLKFLFR
jgi:hypothetical protein